MLKFNEQYYTKIINRYGYMPPSRFLNIAKINAEQKWLCSYNLRKFVQGVQKKEKSLVIMGIGINGTPHFGTVSQLLRAIYLQKQGLKVQIILGDLDVYGARSKDIAETAILVKKYKYFIERLGFDLKKGEIRNQYNHDEILKTAFLISKNVTDKDFVEIEEEINKLYIEKDVYAGMSFSVKQSILLMFADFIHPGLKEGYKHVLIMSGIDEHNYVRKANEIRDRSGIHMTISGLFSRMLVGLNHYPKMSKSIKESTINVEVTKEDIRKIFESEHSNCEDCYNSIVFQMILNISSYNAEYIERAREAWKLGGKKWEKLKEKYIDDLYKICRMWY